MHSPLGRGLLTFLFLAAAIASSRGDDTYTAAPACRRQPYVCGTVSIAYPFYLSNETEAPHCGYPGLAVRCDGGNTAILQLGADNYKVSRIDYDNLTVSLADAAAATGSCVTVDHNVTFPPGAQLFLSSAAVDYLLFFLDCAFGGPKLPAAPDGPKPPSIKPITCGGGSDKGPGPGAVASFLLPVGAVPRGLPGTRSQERHPARRAGLRVARRRIRCGPPCRVPGGLGTELGRVRPVRAGQRQVRVRQQRRVPGLRLRRRPRERRGLQ
jgi:hypothetical protein